MTDDSPPPRSCLPRSWTPAKQRVFLAALLDSGSVSFAVRAAGRSRSSANRPRARLKGTPFDRTWTLMLAAHAERLADPFPPTRAASQARP